MHSKKRQWVSVLTWGMNSSFIEELSHFFDCLWVVDDVQWTGLHFQSPLKLTPHRVTLINHLKHRWWWVLCNASKTDMVSIKRTTFQWKLVGVCLVTTLPPKSDYSHWQDPQAPLVAGKCHYTTQYEHVGWTEHIDKTAPYMYTSMIWATKYYQKRKENLTRGTAGLAGWLVHGNNNFVLQQVTDVENMSSMTQYKLDII